MKADQFHVLLILISCIVAYLIPFELFLFSYIILGALHYLTELAWLHEKKYFTSSAKIELIIIFICAVGVSLSYICYRLEFDLSSVIPFWNSKSATHFIFLAFIMAFSAIFLKKRKEKIVLLLLSILGIYLFRNQFYYLFLIGLLLPTLIHVFIFTGIFMLVGIKKNPTFWTKICFITFIVCAISFAIVPASLPVLSEKVKSNYFLSGFDMLNKVFIALFDGTVFNEANKQLIFESTLSIKIQRFVAFAYTYHYLNWFSKVHIIAWHKVNKLRLSLAILLWIMALGIYFYDFKTGILTLYFLSTLHVLMEFPLNMQSFQILIQK
ncbi:hypothetical protein V9L05_22170 (plasmid) [Bernardetia sp. Wsw4-3y2]|uniref:hypothetical protein n=1 Tax=unclassified Bernardetia TaxID=2647129 RepID=UPI0030D43760